MGVAAPVLRVPASLRRILVVEDDPDTQVIVSFALKRGGFTVDLCGNGSEALRKALATAPDLVLLDVMLPFMDGPAILREMRADAALAPLPVVFMTARAMPDELAYYRQLDVLDVIVKPFDAMTLAETVAAIWARHHRDRSRETADRQTLEAGYIENLGGRVLEIERLAAHLPSPRAPHRPAPYHDIFHRAHRLTGSSAILGFMHVSAAARAVENLALAAQRRRRRPSAREREDLSAALEELRRSAAAVTRKPRAVRRPR
jgi:two-component system, OmpR family, response regulator